MARRPPTERTAHAPVRARGTHLPAIAAFPTASEQFRAHARGDTVEVWWEADGAWYRAQVEAVNESTGQARVAWEDTASGTATVALEHLRSIPGEADSDDAFVDELAKLGIAKNSKRHKADPKAMEQNERFRTQMETLSAEAGESVHDFRSDVSRKVMLQALYAVTAELIPTAANKYATEANESAAYAFNALANKLQELSRELQGLESLEEQAQYIVSKLLTPMLVRSTGNLINSMGFINSRINDLGLPAAKADGFKSFIEDLMRQHVLFVEEGSRALEQQISEYLVGDVPVKARATPALKPKRKTARPQELEYVG